ncbi:MAG: hypothetical protein PHV49_04870 [Alistipes sp.]|nr:hypothetical protein [Alistipes sp.]
MKNSFFYRIGRTLSVLFHPFGIPTLGTLILLFGPTIMVHLPSTVKWFLVGIVVLNTLLLPILCIGILQWFKLIPNLSLQEREDRVLPMVVVSLCYLLCILVLSERTYAFLITRFMIAGVGCILSTFFINFYWKISLHMTAIGGLVGMLGVLSSVGLGQLQGYLFGALIAGGALGSARLYLGYHRIEQIAAGFVLGLGVSIGLILFL